MSTTLAAVDAPVFSITAHEKQRRFLNAYWLRPENAMWMVLRSDALDAVPLEPPILDLSCGDGIFSFLHAGGRFASEFDVFTSVRSIRSDEADRIDLFDYLDDDYHPSITAAPAYRIGCGTDCKKSSLEKAARLGFYDRLLLQDHEQPLPLPTAGFATVYCNAAYWVENIESFLEEVRRVTQPQGTIVMQVKLDAIGQFTFERWRPVLGDRWLDLIDRGRSASWPTLADRRTWEQRFDEAGLEIVQETPFVTGTHAHLWDVGLRPIAPVLTRTMASIPPHFRREIKRDWVDLFCHLLEPFCKSEMDLFSEGSDPVEMQYVLTPR